jgi:hypothetical protein
MNEEKKQLLFFEIRKCHRLELKRIYQCVDQLVRPPRLSRKDKWFVAWPSHITCKTLVIIEDTRSCGVTAEHV